MFGKISIIVPFIISHPVSTVGKSRVCKLLFSAINPQPGLRNIASEYFTRPWYLCLCLAHSDVF